MVKACALYKRWWSNVKGDLPKVISFFYFSLCFENDVLCFTNLLEFSFRALLSCIKPLWHIALKQVFLKNTCYLMILFVLWCNTDGLRISHRSEVSTVCLPKPIIIFLLLLFSPPNPPKQVSIMHSLHLNPHSFLHVQSLGWSPDYHVNHSADKKSRVTPNSSQGFYLSCLHRCLGILMQKERMII